MVERKLFTARLTRSLQLSPETKHLEFEVEEAARFDFVAGQFISMVAQREGRDITRAYSIASAPHGDNRFELCLNRVAFGFFSNFLCDLDRDGEVKFHGPHGYFVLRSPLCDSIFIGTGTGVAPLRGMLHWLFADEARHAGRDIWLVYGMRTEQDIYYHEEFEALEREHPNFHYVVTLSRADAAWTGRRGYVQDHVREIAAGRTDADAYICGLKNMVTANRALLQELGWDKRSILYERFD
jgi:ferredoxin-NADP reductase